MPDPNGDTDELDDDALVDLWLRKGLNLNPGGVTNMSSARSLDGLAVAGVVRVLTLDDAVSYFRHIFTKEAAAGALKLERLKRGWAVHQVLLDDEYQPLADAEGRLLGRRFIALTISDELEKRLKETDLLIFT